MTAKLSRRFYEKLGDDVANELVEWFNQVDATYRADLREFNELNFARFDSKLDQFRARFDAKLDQLESRVDVKLGQLESRFDVKLSQLEGRFDVKLATLRSDLLKWMFLFWVTTLGALIAFRG